MDKQLLDESKFIKEVLESLNVLDAYKKTNSGKIWTLKAVYIIKDITGDEWVKNSEKRMQTLLSDLIKSLMRGI